MKLIRVVFAKSFQFPGLAAALPLKQAAGADFTMRVEDGVVVISHAKSERVIGVPVAQCELLEYAPVPQGPKKVA